MNTKKKKNRIILCLCSIFVLVASIFSFIPFAKDIHLVKADSVLSDYSFSGSNISSKTTFSKGLFSYNYFNIDYIGDFNSLDYISVSPYLELQSNYVNEYLNINYNNDQYEFTRGNYGDILTHFKFVNLLPNTIYTISFVPVSVSDTSARCHFASKYDIQNSLGSTLFSSFTTDSNGEWIINYGVWISARNCSFVVSNVSLVQGSSVLPYVPYQDSTQVNYEFDIRVRNANYTNFVTLEFGVDFNIQDSLGYDYAVVGGLGSSTIYNIDRLISLPYSFLPTANPLYAYRYDYSNSTFDRNYYFELPFTIDYVETFNPSLVFNGNIKYVVLGSYKDRDTYFHYDTYQFYHESTLDFLKNGKYNFISYVDENGNNLNFYIPLDSSVDSDYFNFRTYYLSNEFLDSSVYTNGYRDGYISGEDNGYKNGYKTGKNDGYNLGYNQALNNGQKYTFTALISSVIDVPVKAFTSLFNFEILGVNLSGFFLGLLTCCIVIGVIRLIL